MGYDSRLMAIPTGVLTGDDPVGTLDDYLSIGGSEGLTNALARTPQEIIDEITRSGLRWRGGAGFSTGQKWSTVAGDPSSVKYAVCNAAESEPGTFKDRWLMRRNPYPIIEGLAIAAYATGAQQAYIALKRSFTLEVKRIHAAIDEMTAAGLLGRFPIEVIEGPDEYLFGEEKAMMEVIEGNLPLPRILPPYEDGLFSTVNSPNPTVANNAETLAHAAHIMRRGADWFRSTGAPSSPGTMLLTVSGDVQAPGVYELPLGITLRTLVEEIAGGPGEGRSIKAIMPGASSAVITPELLDATLGFDEMKAAGSGLGSGGFIVYDDTTCMVKVAAQYSRFLAIESCGQCPACKLNSGSITEALERIEAGNGTEEEISEALALSEKVTDAARCALPSGEALLVASLINSFADEFQEHLGKQCPRARELPFPKLTDYDETAGRFSYDERYHLKRSDWTYAETG
jgi:NADH-quinone oxidoreductase subunit F